jgi:hypothetical protein
MHPEEAMARRTRGSSCVQAIERMMVCPSLVEHLERWRNEGWMALVATQRRATPVFVVATSPGD